MQEPITLVAALETVAKGAALSWVYGDPVPFNALVAPLQGEYELNDALQRLLADQHCRVEMINANTFVLLCQAPDAQRTRTASVLMRN
jgi:hypothetical protein